MDGDIAGIRITPSVVEFHDTEPNTLYEVNITVKNISKTSKNIRYYGPKLKKFKLKVKNPEKPVAPGLCIPAVLEYESPDSTKVKDRLVITVDGEVVEIPVHVHPAQPLLDVDRGVDFGNVVANSKVLSKSIKIVNHGSKPGEFRIKYSGDKPISILPTSGIVPPKSRQSVKVELVTNKADKIDEEFKVKLEGCEKSKALRVRGNIMERALELLSMESEEKMDCIKFGSTYYGTDKTQHAILYNNGPEPVSFVAILDEDAIAQEAGVDLTMTTEATLADQSSPADNTVGKTNVLTSLVTAIPNQGILAPWEKTPVFFRFSPRWHASRQGWKSQTEPPPRKDFALFMHIQMIGANNGFMSKTGNVEKTNVEGTFVEVALTGTALPVLLDIQPKQKYNFGECPVGEHVDLLCTLNNKSNVLPASYQFRKIAHFNVHPPTGKISPKQSQDIIISFAPNQVGSFKPQQMLDVIGQVADDRNPIMYHYEVIHSFPLQFIGQSDPISVKKAPKFNPGITPQVTNEVGMYVDTKMSELKNDQPRNAVSHALKCNLHTHKSETSSKNEDDLVTFPNDRACSIRPSNRKESYKTIFTKSRRYNYVDPDYAYTDEEETVKKSHKNHYRQMLRNIHQLHLNVTREKEYRETNNSKDIGIKTAAGLRPKKLTQDEIKPDPPSPRPPNDFWKLLSRKELAEAEMESVSKPIQDGLNAVPVSDLEKADCCKILSPQELHKIIIGPPVVDFGEVCLRSVNTKDMNIINNLDQYILVEAVVDCRELRQTSPLSQVVPPNSRATLPFIFESNNRGKFQRSVTYSINGFYKDHVTVQAEVVSVGLQLSTDNLILQPSPGLPAEAGFRGVITLYNRHNYPADFTWSPNLGEKGTAFSIRPASGTVDAYKDLACEVVWHPSYLAPEDGSFSLMVHGGNTLQLQCKAQLGETLVQFTEHRILFGQVPVHLTTTKKAFLQNPGQNHAYFQVMDPCPFPGLTIAPVHGVVPVGGHAELMISLTPDAILKFDTRLEVAIKGWKNMELRIGGSVEPPSVDINLKDFNFGGVYCGSGNVINFKLSNKMATKARVEVDLTRHTDFSLNFPRYQTAEDYMYQLLNPGIFTVTLLPEQIVEGELIFMPSEVAAYDFVMPILINQTKAPTPISTPIPASPNPSQKSSIHIINPRPQKAIIITPRRHVIATALRQPLQLSTNQIEIALPCDFFEMAKTSGVAHTKGTVLVNNSDKALKWAFDLTKPNKALDEGVFRFVRESGAPFSQESEIGVEGTLDPGQTENVCINFCPNEPGIYECLVPVILNGEKEKPYQYLRVIGILKSPRIWFEPPAINLTPAPLVTEVSADFTILAAQYRKVTKINVSLSEIESIDGSPVSPFKVFFPEGNEIKPCCGDEAQVEPFALPCRVIFSSPKPVSCRVELQFTDDEGKSFTMPVTATADNCLLTCYPFLAQHRTDHQIVCEQGVSLKGRKTVSKESVNAGEAVFVRCASPNHNSRPSTSATSSNFMVSSSSYETSVSESTASTPMPRTGAMNKPPSASEPYSSKTRQDMASRSLGSAMFPDEDSEEGAFHMEVLMAAQRWFSSQGWPAGPYPITVPLTLRSGISRKPPDEEGGIQGKGGWHLSSVSKEYKTIYDMITHLSGRPMPGIPINTPLPSDPVERVKQIYWQHSTLLTFLRCQGACVSSVKPQYLMEPRDFKLWKTLLEMERQAGESHQMTPTLEDEALEEEAFEAVSKRAWTDVLLQLFKCLVLAKITPRTMKTLAVPNKNVSLPPVNADPLCSNVYGVGERILLAWLNHHYEHYRLQVWENCPKGGVPPSRWVVNFDFDLLDGLVLGALLGAHMPFLVKSHLNDMYTHPNSAEQCLHNALQVVNAMRFAGIDYDIQAIDITDPNPITLLMLTYHLYQRLPQYIPKSTVDFTGSLHAKIVRQVKLSNPSSKALVYQVLLAGRDARDFRVPKGETVTVSPKSTYPLSIEFQSRFLRPTEAVLVLIGRRQGSAVGSTLVFSLGTQVDNIIPRNVVKVEGPCYELAKVTIPVTNPFNEGGEFQIVLMEAKGNSPGGDISSSMALFKPKEKKKKKIRSKIDHGQSKAESPISVHIETTDKPLVMINKEDSDTAMMNAFFSPSPSVYLMPQGTASVEINFLPFHTGERQCSVILINDKIGELFYSIEANALLPLSSVVPFKPTKHSVRISSAAAAGHGKGLYGGDDRVVYWKCEVGQTLTETLIIPVVNSSREKALLLASQQLMSDVEIERRRVTGTLLSSAVTARTISGLTSNPAALLQQVKKSPNTSFTVEINSKYFTAQSTLSVPTAGTPLPKGIDLDLVPPGINLEDGVMMLHVKFKATQAGHYPCQILLKCQDDIRVVKVECTVNPEGSTAEIEFSAPVHHSVVQNLPVINSTKEDWDLKATVEGEGFSGPPTLLARAGQTTNYPLMFRPSYEAEITGKATLMNPKDRTDHVFMLRGQGEKPLALDHIQIQCEAKKSIMVPLMVPNQTRKKLTFGVESDLSCVGGNVTISVLPGKSGIYNMEVMPSRRGVLKGVISFTAGKNPVLEVDSDGDEITSSDNESSEYYGYQVWYSLAIKVSPPAPERSLEVKSACHKAMVVEVLVRNPTSQEITLEATIKGRDLSGLPSITLPAGSNDVYLLTYFPSVTGKFSGSLIFYNEIVGEFWYDLVLIGESPVPTSLPHMECELGKWSSQIITLKNPSHEDLELITSISNTNNFTLERDNERPIELPALSQIEIPVNFMPSALGTADHNAKISFFTQQLGEWVFSVTGTGLLPQPQEPSCVYTSVGSNTTLIIPFRNPTDYTVLINILLKDKEKTLGSKKEFPEAAEESPFCLLLKHRHHIRVGPKSTLDIPISFAPTNMVLYESLCTVVMRREDKQPWPYTPTDDKGNQLSSSGLDGLTEICWRFPVHGIPESQTVKDSQASVLECRARERVEERLEVILTGVAPSSSGQYPHKAMKTRAITPKNQPPRTPEGIMVTEEPIVAEEFTHHLVYDCKEAEESMKNAVAVTLVRQHRDKVSGLVALVFNLVYAPFKAMNYSVHLHVTGATGGVWKFPLKFVASEPEVDDTISIEATGLNRQSRVAFRLHSQSSHPELYKAYFLGGSDPEFSVTPQTGELLPQGTGGTLIQVDFLPTVYGKLYQGKLIIQTSEMQWSYNVRGVLPDYSPPLGRSSAPISGPHPDPRARKDRVNYIRNNLKLTTTAVSSPVKGAPLIQRMKIM